MIRVVAGALVRDGRVLACRRGPEMSGAGHWELPGGKVESGETDVAALRRELAEELGLEVEVGACLGESRTSRILLVGYLCTATGTPVLREHDALVWADAAAVDGLGWGPADLPLVAALKPLLA